MTSFIEDFDYIAQRLAELQEKKPEKPVEPEAAEQQAYPSYVAPLWGNTIDQTFCCFKQIGV